MKLKFGLFLLLGLIIAIIISGCGGSGGSVINDDWRGGGETWTVMVYLNADNDLEPYSILNVNQMERIGSTDKVKIVVQWDRSPGFSIEDGDWTGTRRYLIQRDTTNAIASPVLEDMGEQDMGDPQVMKDFINWAQTNYPADKYCLVIWNHGSGWRSVKPTACITSRNISFDDTSGTSIRTTDLPDILRSAIEPIDVVAMDASLMQMLEVAYELKNTAGLLVGSEESPPGDGYVYDKWLGPLVADPQLSPLALAQIITDSYVQSYEKSFAVTESVVDLSKISQVAFALDDFAAALIPYAVSHAAELRAARENAQYYSYDEYMYKDLLDYAKRVEQAIGSASVSSAYSSLVNAMGQAVLYEAHAGNSVENSHGLSIWVPTPTAYTIYRARYSTLKLSQDTRWDDFLEAQVQ